MNFPTHFHDHWRGQRDNCFNRVLRHDFAAKVYKIGVRLDFTCANCDGSVAVVGCIHCNNNSHTPAHYHEQLEQDAAAIHRATTPTLSSPTFKATATPTIPCDCKNFIV